MNNDLLIDTLDEQNKILRDISRTQKQPKFLVLKVLAVFGLGFALGSASHICRKLHNAIDDTFDEIWKKSKNSLIKEMDAEEKEVPTDSQE